MSTPTPCCIIDGLRADAAILTELDGAWYCSPHAKCAACGKPFCENVGKPSFVTCSCSDYGSYGHEEMAYCSVECLDSSHPEPPDRDPEPEEEV